MIGNWSTLNASHVYVAIPIQLRTALQSVGRSLMFYVYKDINERTFYVDRYAVFISKVFQIGISPLFIHIYILTIVCKYIFPVTVEIFVVRNMREFNVFCIIV